MCSCRKRISHYFWFLLFILVSGCKDDEVESRYYPVVDTHPVSDINTSGVTFNAEVLNMGPSGIKDHGFVYGTYSYPNLENSDKISLGSKGSIGSFSALGNRNMVKDVTYYVRAYAISSDKNIIVYGQGLPFISKGSTPPEVTDFNPKSGSIGDTITISGSGFSNVNINHRVLIGNGMASVVKASEDLLTVVIPPDVQAGEQQVKVFVGQYEMALEEKFLLFPITLTNHTPATISFGDTLLISGNHFPARATSSVQLIVIDQPANIIEITDSTLKAIPSEQIKKPQGIVTLIVGRQTISFGSPISLNKPVITSITPGYGTKDTEVKIAGDNFTSIPANIDVRLNNTKINVISADHHLITVKIPSGILPGIYPFSVTIAEQTGQSVGFQIIKPSIFNIAPLTGTWNEVITITGENFSSIATNNIVSFNGINATVVSATPSELKVTIPLTLVKKNSTVTVKVLTTDNQTATFGSPFVLNGPLVTDFNPKEGKSGTIVTITGQNFSPIITNQVVTFGSYTAQVISATATSMIVKVPTGIQDDEVSLVVISAEQSSTLSVPFHLISPWRRIADFPSNARTNCTAFSVDGYGYVGLGTKATQSSPADYFKYDATANSWSSIPNFSYFGSGGPGSFVGLTSFILSNEAYVGLGSIGTGVQNRFSKYDPISNTWINAKDCETADGAETAVGYSINNKGYVATGRGPNGQPTSKMLEFDPIADQWTRKADFPGGARMGATGFTISGKAYLTTGNSSVMYNDLWAFDPASNSWTQRAALPGVKRWKATGFTVNGKGYVVGGTTSTTRLNDVWQYDAVTNTWSRLEDFPGAARYSSVAFVIGNKVYFGTGSSDILLKDFWEFDPSKL